MNRVTLCMLPTVVLITACTSHTEKSDRGLDSGAIASTTALNTTASTTAASETTNAVPAVQAGRFVDTVASGPPPKLPLICYPRILSGRDTLSLSMKTPHGEYLTVNTPDGTAFFIVYPQLGDSSRKYSLIPSEDFRHVSHLRLPANTLANPRVYGRPNLDTLFTKTGNYVFHIGDNLEGDFVEEAHQCTVRYKA